MNNWCNCNCNWIWFSICCRNCNWIFDVIEFNYSQLLSITMLICISIVRLRFPLAIAWAATTPLEISVLISNCPLWFTPLPLWTNDCNEQTLPAASSCLISLILYIMGSKRMLNKKERKKVRIHNCCLFTWYDLVQLSHTWYAIRCCNIMEPKSIARLSRD